MQTMSQGGSYYFMVVVDDYSRYVWVRFLREKSQATIILTQLMTLLENQLEHKVGTVRSERGGEFLSEKFIAFCDTKGIARQLTNAETPEQNGVAERMNRTLLEKARSMCLQAKTPKSMWTEAINTAAFLANRCPTQSRPNMTPFQLLLAKRPSLDHLRVFGCRVYILQKDKELTKWASRASEGIFLGYDDHTKGFRCWIPSQHKLIISRNVRFDESSILSTRPREVADHDPMTSASELRDGHHSPLVTSQEPPELQQTLPQTDPHAPSAPEPQPPVSPVLSQPLPCGASAPTHSALQPSVSNSLLDSPAASFPPEPPQASASLQPADTPLNSGRVLSRRAWKPSARLQDSWLGCTEIQAISEPTVTDYECFFGLAEEVTNPDSDPLPIHRQCNTRDGVMPLHQNGHQLTKIKLGTW
jgi:transposase InsO family protein